MEIASGLAAASQAIELLKTLRAADKAMSEADFKMKIADLVGLLSDAKIALAEANVALREKDDEIARLTAVQNAKAPTVFYKGYNFGLTDDGEPMGLPFCPTCEKLRGDQIQMVHIMHGLHRCPVCKTAISGVPRSLPPEMIPGR
jgi:hypothetical protein